MNKTNQTIQHVLWLEDELKRFSGITMLHATVVANSKEELKEASEYLKCHLYQPFERENTCSGLNDYEYFDYYLRDRNIYITVRGKEQYRRETVIKEI